MPTGTVKFYNSAKGFGFIVPESPGDEIFFHASDFVRIRTIRQSDRVSYEIGQDPKTKKTRAEKISFLPPISGLSHHPGSRSSLASE